MALLTLSQNSMSLSFSRSDSDSRAEWEESWSWNLIPELDDVTCNNWTGKSKHVNIWKVQNYFIRLIPTSWHSIWYIFWHSNSICHISYSDILSGILFDIPSVILSGMCSGPCAQTDPELAIGFGSVRAQPDLKVAAGFGSVCWLLCAKAFARKSCSV